MGLNIKKLPKTRKFYFLAKDIIKGFEYVNGKGKQMEMVYLKSPISTEDELITMSYNAKFVSTLKIDNKTAGGLKYVSDESETYEIIQLKYRERVGAEKTKYILTTNKDGEFVPKLELEQEDFFEMMGQYEQEVVYPYIEEKINEMNELEKEGEENGETN